jgi:hypothetical protein
MKSTPSEIEKIKETWVGEACSVCIGGIWYGASVVGRKLDFAKIAPFDASIPSVEFCWEAVQRIMSGNRCFVS